MHIVNIKQQFFKGVQISMECKKATSKVLDNVLEACYAFANTYAILLGVVEGMPAKDDLRIVV